MRATIYGSYALDTSWLEMAANKGKTSDDLHISGLSADSIGNNRPFLSLVDYGRQPNPLLISAVAEQVDRSAIKNRCE